MSGDIITITVCEALSGKTMKNSQIRRFTVSLVEVEKLALVYLVQEQVKCMDSNTTIYTHFYCHKKTQSVLLQGSDGQLVWSEQLYCTTTDTEWSGVILILSSGRQTG